MDRAAFDHGIKSDLSIFQSGGFRSVWYPGVIEKQHVHAMFPFKNSIIIFDILGKDAVEMLKRIQNGKLGSYYSDGIRQTVKMEKKITEGGVKY